MIPLISLWVMPWYTVVFWEVVNVQLIRFLNTASPQPLFLLILHYVALGHLHRAQSIPAQCPVWYSGSPLPLDFSETDDAKSINLVEAIPGLPAAIQTIPIKAGKQLKTLRGNLLELSAVAETTDDDLLRILIDADYRHPVWRIRFVIYFPRQLMCRILQKVRK